MAQLDYIDAKLKSNVIGLTLLQIGSYLIPLVILPYLTRVLGVDGFGQIGFSAAFMMYFVLLVEWGFNLSATREVSVMRADVLARSAIFWETVAARLCLLLASIAILVLLVIWVPRLGDHSALLFLGTLQVLAAAISTSFYYQGIERMVGVALINLSIRLLSVPLIFIWVNTAEDVIVAFAIQTGCILLASVVNMLILLISNNVRWIKPTFTGICRKLQLGWPLFLSSAGASLYNNTNAVVLGFVASEAAVGYFVAGFTLVKAVVGLTGPFAHAVFPRVSNMLSGKSDAAPLFLRKMLVLQALLGLSLTVGLWIFLPWGVTWFYGDDFEPVVSVVAWLSFLPLIICIASVLGMQTLIPLGHHRWFANVILICGFLNLIILVPLGHFWGAVGGGVAVFLTELAILLGMGWGLKKLEPLKWQMLIGRS